MKFMSKQGELVENRTKENKYTDKQKESENGKKQKYFRVWRKCTQYDTGSWKY